MSSNVVLLRPLTHTWVAATLAFLEILDIGSKAMKEAAMIEAEMEEMNDQEDCQP